MNASLRGVAIHAVAAALPARALPLSELEHLFGALEVKRIARSTGINAVRVAGALTTGDLCVAAGESLFAQTDVDRASIDGVVVVTQTPDFAMPATSALVAHRLGMRHNVVTFDVNCGCSGYIYGLYQGAMLVSAGGCGRVLVCTGDVITKLLNPDDRHVRLVFGDAATATLVERGSDTLDFAFWTDGAGSRFLNTPMHYGDALGESVRWGHLHMDGAGVMNFALERVPRAIGEFLRRHGVRMAEVPVFLLHQANQFMLEYLAKRLGVTRSKVPVNVGQVGNTGPSSIPLCLALDATERALAHDGAVACGFGVGLSVGVARLPLANSIVVPPVDVLESGSR
ncbi:ketoacyl-ACP synthase III [Paraburkholderia diazotrophica]|uniref:3-oxoacyl-[acyl-carrier-protein] synthase-3 n=1 Tax=Paraburkholderia diazotrophica TaxID=667676 RepID=A0A1H7DJ53_9BURK|nr:ketoacyl-ACP synthase III [Paraburkholderia diazotrophica]SEK00937.1 3-oxoacyl-[acyl-carrier-protein] synthase-3 [Paraburkholderia diazotrophica]